MEWMTREGGVHSAPFYITVLQLSSGTGEPQLRSRRRCVHMVHFTLLQSRTRSVTVRFGASHDEVRVSSFKNERNILLTGPKVLFIELQLL